MLLMILNHLVRLVAETVWISWTVPRLALPIFMVLFGYLYRSWSWRHVDIAIAALATWPLLHELYGTQVPTLAVPLLVLPLMGFATRWPVAVVCVAFIQAAYWEIGWLGYEPGFVLGFITVGVLVRRLYGLQDPQPMGADSLAAFIGRYSLTVYTSHIGLLAIWCSVGPRILGWKIATPRSFAAAGAHTRA